MSSNCGFDWRQAVELTTPAEGEAGAEEFDGEEAGGRNSNDSVVVSPATGIGLYQGKSVGHVRR